MTKRKFNPCRGPGRKAKALAREIYAQMKEESPKIRYQVVEALMALAHEEIDLQDVVERKNAGLPLPKDLRP